MNEILPAGDGKRENERNGRRKRKGRMQTVTNGEETGGNVRVPSRAFVRKRKSTAPRVTRDAAGECMCELFTSSPHDRFWDSILEIHSREKSKILLLELD